MDFIGYSVEIVLPASAWADPSLNEEGGLGDRLEAAIKAAHPGVSGISFLHTSAHPVEVTGTASWQRSQDMAASIAAIVASVLAGAASN